jgi:mannose-6-phosphate isomerase-like protein (cupin superfamily)
MPELAKCTLVNLRELGSVDPRKYFTGSWRSIRLEQVDPGQQLESAMEGIEESYLVVAGKGTAIVGDQNIDLYEGTTLTFPVGSAVKFEAADQRLELFVTTLDV